MSKHKQNLNDNFETIAWSLLFILWGFTILLDFLPASLGVFGTGLILLGLNAARALNGIAGRNSTTIFGVIACVWGGLQLARPSLPPPFKLSDWAIFAILLIVLGLILLTREVLRIRKSVITPGG
jgi:hypothetical protein